MTQAVELFVQSVMPRCQRDTGDLGITADTNSIYCYTKSRNLKRGIMYVYDAPFNSKCRTITFADLPLSIEDRQYNIEAIRIDDYQYIVIFVYPNNKTQFTDIILYKNGVVIDTHKTLLVAYCSRDMLRCDGVVIIGHAIDHGVITEYFVKDDTIMIRKYLHHSIIAHRHTSSQVVHRFDGFLYYTGKVPDILIINTLSSECTAKEKILKGSTNSMSTSYTLGVMSYIKMFNTSTHVLYSVCLRTNEVRHCYCQCIGVGHKNHITCRIGQHLIYETKDSPRKHIMQKNDKLYDVIGLVNGYHVSSLNVMLHETDGSIIIRGFKWNWKLFTMQPAAAQKHAIIAIWALRSCRLPRDLMLYIAEMCLLPF